MRIEIIIYADNAVFKDPEEVTRVLNGRVLERIGRALETQTLDGGKLRDTNGNTVGKWGVTEAHRSPRDI